MKWSQAKMQEYANRSRQPAPEFKVDDMVYLDKRNIKTTRPSHSLDAKNLGPFRISASYGSYAFQLDLPESMKDVHNVFYPWLLHLAAQDPLPGQALPPPGPVDIDPEGEEVWELKDIVDHRLNKARKDPITGKKGLLQYKATYVGYTDPPEWQPYHDFEGSEDAIDEYHERNKKRPLKHEKYRELRQFRDLFAMTLLCALSLDMGKGLPEGAVKRRRR